VLGLAVMVLGLCLMVSAILLCQEDFDEVKVTIDLTSLATLLGVAGAGIFIFALIGCFGALRRSRLMICMYVAMLLAVLLAKLLVEQYLQNNWEYLMRDIEQHMEVVYNQYTKDPVQAARIDRLQKMNNCCGSNSTSEPWQSLHIAVPSSCYSQPAYYNSYNKEKYSEACIPEMMKRLDAALSDERLLNDWGLLHLCMLAQGTMMIALLAAMCLFSTLKSRQVPDDKKFKLLSTT